MHRNKLILLVALASATLSVCFVAVFQWYPILSSVMVFVLVMVVSFMATEGWITHSAQEFENRFWTFTAFLLSCAITFVPDSPLRLCLPSQTYGWMIVVLCTFGVHTYDRHLHRLRISVKPFTCRNHSMEFSSAGRLSATGKVILIQNQLKIIDNKLISSFFQNIFYLPIVINAEREVITALSDTSLEEINYLLPELELGRIFYKIKDHRVVRVFSRSKLLQLLCVERISDLRVAARAALLHALQVMKLSAHSEAEKYVKNIILKTQVAELSRLKMLMDSKGDVHSMHKLVFVDIVAEDVRSSILGHIGQQAKIQEAHITLGTRAAQHIRLFAWRKILSDVDDTLTCSGGSYPSGIDTSYPKKCLYPGVLMFYRELDLGTAGEDVWDQARIGNLVFLSARPHVYRDVSEMVSYNKFRRLVKEKGMHTVPTLLAGSLDAGSAFMWKNDMEPLAKQKFKNFMEYYRLYPEFKYIFVGDNGQGDVRTAEMMLQAVSHKIERLYVHQVQPLKLTTCNLFTSNQLSMRHFCFFVTYIDAALDALQHGLIRASGLRRVAAATVYEFKHIQGWQTQWQRESRLREINESLGRANQVLLRHRLQPVPPMRFTQVFSIGTDVLTPFGIGVVERFRPVDGIYELSVLPRAAVWRDPYSKANVTHLYITLGQLLTYKSKPKYPPPSSKTLPVRLRYLKDIHWCLVWTPYGPALVLSRKLSRIVHVEFIRWKLATGRYAQGYLCADNLVVLDVFKLSTPPIPRPPTLAPTPFNFQPPKQSKPFSMPRMPSIRTSSPLQSLRPALIFENASTHLFKLLRSFSYAERVQSVPPTGTRVQTPFGEGTVVKHRKNDNITVVDLAWKLFRGKSAQAYLSPNSVVPLVIEAKAAAPTSLKQQQQGQGQCRGRISRFHSMFQLLRSTSHLDGGSSPRTRPKRSLLQPGRRVIVKPFGICQVVSVHTSTQTHQLPSRANPVPVPTNIHPNTPTSMVHLKKTMGSRNSNGADAMTIHLFVVPERVQQLSPAFVGAYVYTLFGTGKVQQIRDDGVHVVQCLVPQLICYLQPQMILAVIDAAVGCVVDTEYGTGTVTNYRAQPSPAMFTVQLRVRGNNGHRVGQNTPASRARDAWGYLHTVGPLQPRNERTYRIQM